MLLPSMLGSVLLWPPTLKASLTLLPASSHVPVVDKFSVTVRKVKKQNDVDLIYFLFMTGIRNCRQVSFTLASLQQLQETAIWRSIREG